MYYDVLVGTQVNICCLWYVESRDQSLTARSGVQNKGFGVYFAGLTAARARIPFVGRREQRSFHLQVSILKFPSQFPCTSSLAVFAFHPLQFHLCALILF